jgi:hypothetical protein
MLTLDTILTPNPNVVSRIVDDEAVLVLPERGEVKVFNMVGSRIWELVDGVRTIREISTLICQEFEVNQTTSEQDTLEFVTTILEKGVVNLVLE